MGESKFISMLLAFTVELRAQYSFVNFFPTFDISPCFITINHTHGKPKNINGSGTQHRVMFLKASARHTL